MELIVNPLTLDLINQAGKKEDIKATHSFSFFAKNIERTYKLRNKDIFDSLRND